jgi:hypothetical protein
MVSWCFLPFSNPPAGYVTVAKAWAWQRVPVSHGENDTATGFGWLYFRVGLQSTSYFDYLGHLVDNVGFCSYYHYWSGWGEADYALKGLLPWQYL